MWSDLSLLSSVGCPLQLSCNSLLFFVVPILMLKIRTLQNILK
uniref:Uncharacterized protein n=1 Tax=Anguilla anguilla TaxID=7936 RepID=A0A0E9Q8R4_ANGAN